MSDSLSDEIVSLVNIGQRLLQIDDVDSTAFGQNKALDFGVPAAGLVTKVDARVQ